MSQPLQSTEPDPLDRADAGRRTLLGGGLRAAAWVASAALSLVSIPLLVHHLGLADFGRYVAVISIVNIAALASDLGLGALTLREWSAADATRRPQVLGTLLGLRLAIVAVAAAVAVGFTAVAGYPDRVLAGAAIAVPGLAAQVFGDFALVLLAGSLRFGRVAAVELARTAIGTAGIAILVLADAGFAWFFAAWTAAAILAAALALAFARPGAQRPRLRDAGLVPRFRPGEWRPLLADTAMYAAASAVHVVYFRVVMLTVSLDSRAVEAGLFAVAYRIIEFAAAVGAVLSGTATPVLSRRQDPAAIREPAFRLIRLLLALGAAAALVVGLGAPVLMDLIGGDRTDAAVPVMRIMSPAIATIFAAFGMGAVLLVLRRYRALLLVNLAALTTALGLALALVPGHGARGAAWAALAAELVLFAGQLAALRRAIRRD